MSGDPLYGLAPPSGDAGMLEILATRMVGWATGAADCGSRQQSILGSLTANEWKGLGADSAHSGGEKIVTSYGQAADDIRKLTTFILSV